MLDLAYGMDVALMMSALGFVIFLGVACVKALEAGSRLDPNRVVPEAELLELPATLREKLVPLVNAGGVVTVGHVNAARTQIAQEAVSAAQRKVLTSTNGD